MKILHYLNNIDKIIYYYVIFNKTGSKELCTVVRLKCVSLNPEEFHNRNIYYINKNSTWDSDYRTCKYMSRRNIVQLIKGKSKNKLLMVHKDILKKYFTIHGSHVHNVYLEVEE